MGKKGRRYSHKKNRKENEENCDETNIELTQEEGSAKRCPHLSKAVKLGVLQNHVPHTTLGQCSLCTGSDNEGICICLRCAKQGCDRYSDDKHALSHYDQCPSHNITLHLQSMIAWCYGCDMEVPVVPNSDLHECIKLLIKALKLDAPNDLKLSIPKPGASIPTVKLDNVVNSPNNRTQKIKGLVNLGNTCFFNAVMQNLNQTELLHIAMTHVNQSNYSQRIEGSKEAITVDVTNPAGSLLVSLNKLLGDFRSSAPGPLSPKFLFSEICKKAPRFKGFQQQDSQELLRYLLDSVKTDQLKRVKIGVLKHFEINEGVDIKSLPAENKEKIKEYVHHVTAPCIDSVFAGKLDSIVVCHSCHKESRVTESFLDLSLSLVKQQEQKVKPKSTKSSAGSGGKKENGVNQTEEIKQQPLSKHQQKAAKEAKRKKGRKKGKQRTISRSSEDGSNEVKEQSLQNDDTDITSDHENMQDSNAQDDSNNQTQQDKENEPNSDEGNAQIIGGNISKISSGFCSLAPASLEEKSDLSSKKTDASISKDNSQNESEFTSGQDSELTSPSNNISDDTKNTASKTLKNVSVSEEKQQIHSNSNREMASNIASHNCSTIASTDVATGGKEDDLKKDNDLKSMTNLTRPGGGARNDPNTIEFMQPQCIQDEHTSRSHTEKDSNNYGDRLEENVILCNANGKDTCDQLPEENSENQTSFEEKVINGNVSEMENVYNKMVDCEKRPEITIEECPRTFLQIGHDELIAAEEVKKVMDSEVKTNVINVQDENVSSGLEKCGDAADGEAKPALLEQKVNSLHHDDNDTVDLSRAFQNELTLKGDTKTSTSVPDNDYESLNNVSSSNCSKEHELTGSEDTNIHLSKNDIIESSSKSDSKATNFAGIGNDLHRSNNIEQSEGPQTGEGEENEQEEKQKESHEEKHLETKCSSNQQNNMAGAATNINHNNAFGSCEKNRICTSPAADIPSPEKSDPISCNAVNMEISPHNDDTETSPKVHTIGTPYVPSLGECSVQSCLAQFCSPEVLQGKNKFLCEVCSKRRDEQEDEGDLSSDESSKGAKASKMVYTEATKQLLISSAPPVLTLHLKRFQQVGHGLRKVPKHVEFPFVLDIAPFCCTRTKIASDSSNAVLYSLIGLVEHSGGLNSGHYTACIKLKHKPLYHHLTDLTNIKDLSSFIQDLWTKDERADYTHQRPGDGQWYYVSDSRVTMVTEEKVLRSQAYMLFYERLPLKKTQ